jgi:hypothetical protein
MPMLDPRYDLPSRYSKQKMRRQTGITVPRLVQSPCKTPPRKLPGRKSLLSAISGLPTCRRSYLSRLRRGCSRWKLSLSGPTPVCPPCSTYRPSDCPAESSKIHNLGHYVSVDGRPVNPARGIIKNIVKLYKSFYRVASCSADRKLANVDPFLCMRIRCPPESYDVNIEPAKDDVLFSEPSKVIALAEKLFKDYYGELASEAPTRSWSSAQYQATPTPDDNFDLLLAKKASVTAETSTTLESTLPTQSLVDVPGRTEVPSAEPLRTDLNSCHAPSSIPESRSLHRSDKSPHKPTHAKCSSDVERSGPHFNMYGIDDEDFLTAGSPPLTHHDVSEGSEDKELRSVLVTNPWSLAKLNASARKNVDEPCNQANSGLTIQLMTPGRGQNDPSRHLHRPACQQQSMLPQLSLLSPVASSPTTAAYQNPGPPVRQRAYNERQDQEDDAIESTQNLLTDASHARPVNTLDTWVQPRQPTVRLPSSKSASVSYNGDGIFKAAGRPGFERRERTLNKYLSTELTDPDNSWTEPSRISNHIDKPFRSPFKRRNITSSLLNENLETPDSACAGALHATPTAKPPVPLPDPSPSPKRRISVACYESQSASVPPPPSPSQRSLKMSQAPNTELAEILEFEQRKKAAVLHQRRSQSNRALGELNLAKLAHIQGRPNDVSSVQAFSSQTRHSLPGLDLREEQSNPARNLEIESANSPAEEAGSAINRNSPHRNRYLTAEGRLGNDRPVSDQIQHAGHSDRENGKTRDFLNEAEVRLSEDDPRAYLVRNSRSGQNVDSLSGLSKTGLKIRRTKTARLPLEAIPPDAANHCLKAISPHPFPGTLALATMTSREGEYDEYISCGGNSFVRWSANSRDVTTWQATLQKLISKSYKARLAGETVDPEITVMLTTAIRAHADAYGF